MQQIIIKIIKLLLHTNTLSNHNTTHTHTYTQAETQTQRHQRLSMDYGQLPFHFKIERYR